jgi:hypothetical protein
MLAQWKSAWMNDSLYGKFQRRMLFDAEGILKFCDVFFQAK